MKPYYNRAPVKHTVMHKVEKMKAQKFLIFNNGLWMVNYCGKYLWNANKKRAAKFEKTKAKALISMIDGATIESA